MDAHGNGNVRVVHKIICAEEMKQLGGVTAGVRGINCLSTFDMSVPSSIHATFLGITRASLTVPAWCPSRRSTSLLPLSFAIFRRTCSCRHCRISWY